MSLENKILAIVGMAGSGKSTAVAYLKEQYGYEVVYFGGLVIAETKRLELEIKPENEKIAREGLRAKHGMKAMAVLSIEPIKQALSEGKKALIDGLYSHEELEYLQEEFGGKLVTLAIHTARPIREQRLTSRPERPLTAEELYARDIAEVKNLNKAPPIALADYHFVNDDDEAALKCYLDILLKS